MILSNSKRIPEVTRFQDSTMPWRGADTRRCGQTRKRPTLHCRGGRGKRLFRISFELFDAMVMFDIQAVRIWSMLVGCCSMLLRCVFDFATIGDTAGQVRARF